MDYIKEATLKQEKDHQKLLAAIRKAEEAEMTNEEPISGLMVKCTPERGHNALFFIPLQVFIML